MMYTVSGKITGKISIQVEADDEHSAIEQAKQNFSIDNIEEWEEIASTLEAEEDN